MNDQGVTIRGSVKEGKSARKKAAILALPENAPKPKPGDPHYTPLYRYTSVRGNSYDVEFDTAVRGKFRHWFPRKQEERKSPADKKAEILAMPPGSSRPKKGTVLADALQNYTRNASTAYDGKFDVAVRLRFPDWFERSSAAMKSRLLGLPAGSVRPKSKNDELGEALVRYTNRSQTSYDAVFHDAIRAKFPHWFPKEQIGYMAPDGKKSVILAMPAGSPKPRHPSEMAIWLMSYALPSQASYDPEFRAAVEAKFPHWFPKDK